MSQPRFRSYDQHQLSLLPPSLDELIDEHHVVRLVNRIIDGIDLSPLLAQYEKSGGANYHPSLMLKVLVYAYLNNTYSSRKIEGCVRENIHFMWLAGMQTPDHNTINRFRTDRLGPVLKTVFGQVVHLLAAEGYVDLKRAYLDGTKIEANAGRYTFVWGKSLKTSKARIARQLEELWLSLIHI